MAFPPRARSLFRRRDVLRLAALAPLAVVSAACGLQSASQGPDPLEALWRSARSDSALALTIAKAYPDIAAQARTVATQRGEHATALRQEIDRVNPSLKNQPSSTAPTPPPAAPASSGAASTALTNALHAARNQAGNLVPTVPWYRAGLLGSISASCASLVEVMA